MWRLAVALLSILASYRSSATEASDRPHIVFILADDLGYNDIGYNGKHHGSATETPFLDKLAEDGVRLENYYVQSTCSPSRTQLMSGRYQIHTGMQHKIKSALRHGLPLDNKIIPEQLKNCGYDTHMVGKWHLGMFKWDYTPMYRGFNSFFGFLRSENDHFTHSKGGVVDMWNNTTPTDEYSGNYSTHLFTEKSEYAIKNRDQTKPFFLYLAHQAVHSPLQVPREYQRHFKHIKDRTRRKYAGMLLALDESVKNITKQLEVSGMLNDTIFIFSTDNGASPRYGGNNWPLRGEKNGLWEGGVKAVGFVSGKPLGLSGAKRRNLMHISDWLPTIMAATGCPLMSETPPLDGFNQWPAITQGEQSPRTEILHALDPDRRKKGQVLHGFDTSIYAAIRVGPWKLITGGTGNRDWTPPPESGIAANQSEKLPPVVRLYHIESDPYERNELSAKNESVLESLLRKLAAFQRDSVPVWFPEEDDIGNARENGRKFAGPWIFDNATQEENTISFRVKM